MKKLILVAALALTSGLLFGQVSVNPKGGINLSGINDQPDGVSTNNHVGFNVGLDLRLGEGTFFFQPGAFYYQYNQEFSVVQTAGLSNTLSRDIKVQSIKIPALLGIRVIEADLLGLRLNAGPAFNFPVKVSGEGTGFDIDRGDYKDIVVGGVVGAGVDLAFFTIDLNYEFGLSDYIDFDSEQNNFSSQSSRQYVVSLAFGVNF